MESSQNTPRNSPQNPTRARKLAGGTRDTKPKFHVDYLLGQDTSSDVNYPTYNHSPRYNRAVNDVTHDNWAEDTTCDDSRPTKRLRSSSPSCRISSPTTVSYDSEIARSSVLQVLQPTSTSVANTCSPANEHDPQPLAVSSQQPALSVEQDLGSKDATSSNEDAAKNPKYQKQGSSRPLIEETTTSSTSIAALAMPSLTALATYPMFNWCAKCNSSFRMTSDLVHHMRTQHKGHRSNQ